MAEQIHNENYYKNVRLPTAVKPIHYEITLRPDLQKCVFSGNVKIDYVSSETVNRIVLNANNLKISDGSIDNNNALKSVTYSNETATLEFKNPIVSQGSLFLDFDGVLNDKMQGFYRTNIKIEDQTITAATTQFEATDARQCIPCWDEPAVKATFSVTMVFDKWIQAGDKKYECIALSNMPVVSASGPESALEVKFDKSPIMSTYLLAFAVGPFDYIEGSCKGRPVRVYTTPGKKEQGKFALDVACKSLEFYESYFNVDYPLPKLDLIAVPDFASGAMENWGLVTYRETCLLVDPNNTSTLRKQYIAVVVAHELAHQWFGNLVTMEWWTHLWLNEGFASFMENFCTDRLFPEYDMWSQFVTNDTGCALRLDSLHNSHPIEVAVNHPSEINEIFDDISYQKGSAVIRMLYNYIGDDCFRKGMKDYLSKFAYKNAVTEDLWDALEKASNKPIRRLMSGWTAQKGYPWLKLECTMDGNDAKINIVQSKFTADGNLPADEAKMTWMVPLSSITGDAPSIEKEVCLLDSTEHEVTIKNLGDNWLKFNPGTIGLYRCAYSAELSKRLLPAISSQKLPAMDRLGVQDDFYALCQAGHTNTAELLELLTAYKAETSHPVWQSIGGCLSRLNTLLSYTDYQAKFHAFGRELYEEVYKRLTWAPKPNEPHGDALLRPAVIDQMITFGDRSTIDEALKRFSKHVSGEELIPADLRGPCYKAVGQYGDEAGFQALMQIYKTSDLSEEQNRALRALGFTRDTERRKRIVEFVMSDEVRNQDKMFVIFSLGSGAPSVAWDLLRNYKDKITELYGKLHTLSFIVKACCENFASEERAQEMAKFFEENKFHGAERSAQQCIEKTRLNANWLKRDSEKIRAFLSSY